MTDFIVPFSLALGLIFGVIFIVNQATSDSNQSAFIDTSFQESRKLELEIRLLELQIEKEESN